MTMTPKERKDRIAKTIDDSNTQIPPTLAGNDIVNYRMQVYRDRYKAMTAVELVTRLSEVTEVLEYLDGIAKWANAECDVLRYEMIEKQMEKEGLESPLNVTGVGRISLSADLNVSIPAENKDEFYAWLRKNKSGDLIQQTVNSSTLKAFIKDRIKNGKSWPTNLLKATPITRASLTRAK